MELLEVFYRRKLRKKEKKLKLGHSEGALCRSPSEASVNSLATGLISRVLRFTSRRSEPASRPHSWHSTKICEDQQEIDEGPMDTMISAWPQSIHSRFDSTGGYLRKSPDQYSSRGSMESLDHPQPSPLHSAVQRRHPPENRGNTGSHPAYSSCHQLSSARSSNSIDHPHSKRDSAYSSFSTSSSIPDYHAPTTSFSAERSYSLETVPQRGRGSVGGVCYHGTGSGKTSGSNNRATVASNRHSVGPIWGPTASHSSYENLQGPPGPPRRSDSYTAIRNHERPNSWSSLENVRSLRSLQKGSWHHSSGPVAFAKGSHGIEGQLHTVIEKSPESSPTTKPRQGGGFNQPPLPSLHSSKPASPNHQPSCLTLPATTYPVPPPEHHYAYCLIPGPSGVYPALDKDNRCQHLQRLQCVSKTNEGVMEGQNDEKLFTIESNQNTSFSPYTHSSYSTCSSTQPGTQSHEADRREKQDPNTGSCRPHMKTNRGKLDGQTDAKKPPNHQGLYSQSFEGFHSTKNLGPHQEHNQQLSITNVHSSINFRSPSSQELNDHRMPVQSWGNRSSDPAAPQYHDWNQRDLEKDRENPLTRLEIALAEVQGFTSPEHLSSARDHDNINFGDGTQGPARSLSVLEKVSCFEHRENSENQHSQNTSNSHNKTINLQMTEKSHNVPSGVEDLRNIIKRSSKGTKAHKTMSNRGGGSEYMKHSLFSEDPRLFSLKSSGYVDEDSQSSRTLENPSFALQRSLSSFQLNVSRTEGTSKDAPWRREVQEMKDPLQDMSSNSHQSSTVLTKYLSLEKKGPQTMPKPQGIVIKQQSPISVTSPHTPKERHEIVPDVRGPSSSALPRVPPVEPFPLLRVCGRKRLTADQRKCSYSEPENINEVGVSSAETAALFWFGRETSVADRRKMFELAVSHQRGRETPSTISRPGLRLIKQDAVTEYAERKREVKKEKEEQRSDSRPPCANQQPVHGTHTGRVTTQGLPAHPVPSGSSHGFHAQIHQDLIPCSGPISRQSLSHQHPQLTVEPHQSLELSKELSGVLQRAVLSQKSASAEDLLEDSEGRLTFPHHLRSHSSPTAETLNENFHPGKVKMIGVTSSEPGGCAVAADRAEDIHMSGEAVSPQPSQYTNSIPQLGQPSKDHCHTPVTRRERQRSHECQRAHSTSTLAASVGLPSNFTPLMTKDSTTEWKANERLSQANLDAITFPDTPQTSTADGDSSKAAAVGTTGNGKSLMTNRWTRHSLSGTRKSEDTKKDTYGSEDAGLKMTGRHSPENGKLVSSALLPHCKFNSPNGKAHERTPLSPAPSSHSSVHQNLPSLSLLGFINQQQSLETVTRIPQEDFLQSHDCNLTPLHHIPAQQINEINPAEDFPPHPPPLKLKQETQQRPSQKPPLCSVTSVTSFAKEDNLGFEYQLLPKREKTFEELRVEALTRQLELQDSSLAFFMDTCGGKSIIELMGEIFPSSGVTGKSDQQHKGSPHADDRIQQRDCSLAQIAVTDQGREINRDEEERVLNNRKVDLCEALRKSVAALQREKQQLCDEQKSQQALGDSIDTLVQERLKANERDKYNMFIGDLEKIVNLLMSLCSRLARIDRCLLALDKHELMSEDAKEERDSLNHKRSLLLRQTEDARELKENLDRRQRVVHTILSSYLTKEQLQDYCHFVSTKSSLLIQQRHVDELIRQGGEQLTRLAENLPAEVAEAHSWLTAYRLSSATPHSSLVTSLLPPSVIPGSAHLFRSTSVTIL